MNTEPNFLEEQLALVRKSCEIASHNAEVEINELIKKSSEKVEEKMNKTEEKEGMTIENVEEKMNMIEEKERVSNIMVVGFRYNNSVPRYIYSGKITFIKKPIPKYPNCVDVYVGNKLVGHV